VPNSTPADRRSEIHPTMDRSEYLAERAKLIDLELEMSKQHDNTMVIVAGGALALSLSFVAVFKTKPDLPYLLVAAWVMLLVSLGATVCSALVSTRSLRLQRDYWDQHYENPNVELKCASGTATVALNTVATAALVIGVAALVGFAAVNFTRGTCFRQPKERASHFQKGAYHDCVQRHQEEHTAP
jgi:hypothetical protein